MGLAQEEIVFIQPHFADVADKGCLLWAAAWHVMESVKLMASLCACVAVVVVRIAH